MSGKTDRQKVVVVGAGPVGALAALYAAERGDDVEIYELRADLRHPSTTPLNFTKSINLALSERGINSLRLAKCHGLLDSILDETIPMHARMVHGRGKLGEIYQVSQEYDVGGKAIQSIDRARLNKKLLDALEAMPNVTFFFQHKLTGADFKKNKAWFEEHTPARIESAQNATHSSSDKVEEERSPEMEVDFDLLIGADGAHSAARYHMMKFVRMSYQQAYIDMLWCEFHIAPSSSGFAISPNHLHIWPGGSIMFIAIPSLDKSFVCTLFAPQSVFENLSTNPSTQVPAFFEHNFPGVTPNLISTPNLIDQFRTNPHLPLISIKCTPYHYKSNAVIVGDAAHAMVPFYGQGMNAGLEDVRVLFDFLDRHGVYSPTDAATRQVSRSEALAAYSIFRTPDAAAINDLALRNYEEMSSAVTSPVYRLRKFVEERINKYFPSLGWSTQYSRVSFGNERYSEVERAVRSQGVKLLSVLGVMTLGVAWAGSVWLLRGRQGRLGGSVVSRGFSWAAQQSRGLGR